MKYKVLWSKSIIRKWFRRDFEFLENWESMKLKITQRYDSEGDFGNIIEDLDFDKESVTLTLSSGKTILINKQTPRHEIWLSSPISGAWHFSFKEEEQKWISSDGYHLLQRIDTDINSIIN